MFLAGRPRVADGRLGGGSKAMLVMASTAIVIGALKTAAPVLVPLLVAACIAAATIPIVSALRRMGWPTYAAVTATIFGVLTALTGFSVLVGYAVSNLSDSLPKLESAMVGTKQEMLFWMHQHRLQRFSEVVSVFDPGEAGKSLVSDLVLVVPGALSAIGVVFFVVIFILLEAATFEGKLRRALHWRAKRLEDAQHTVEEVQKYLLVKSAVSAATGIACGAWSAAMHQDNSVLWGLLSFTLNFVPVFGSIVATGAATAAAWVQMGPGGALVILAGYAAINNLIGNLIEPRVLGKAVGLSPLVVTISIVVWGWILGPAGALLSVPLTMIVKIVLAHTEDMRWVAVLLGPGEGRQEEEYVESRRRSRLTRGLPPLAPQEVTSPAPDDTRRSSAPA